VVGTRLTELGGNYGTPVFDTRNDAVGRGVAAVMGAVATDYPTDFFPTAIYGANGAVNGVGVYGEALEKFSIGVHAVGNGLGSTGLLAVARGASGKAIFVDATNDRDSTGIQVQTTGTGVYSTTNGDYRTGLWGTGKGSQGIGVQGTADFGTGVIGQGGTVGVSGSGSQGVNGQGQSIGVVGSGPLIGVVATAYGDSGVGITATGNLAGVVANVPAGKTDGPGVWGGSGQDLTAADATGLGTGVLGTSPRIGVAGIGGGSDFTALKKVKGENGIVGIGLGGGSRGVHGIAPADSSDVIAVLGEAAGGANTAVIARASGGATGLTVRGLNRFSQAGTGSFAAGNPTQVVRRLNVTADSGILVTLNGDPGPGIVLRFARLNATAKTATLQLSAAPLRAVDFTYFIVDSPRGG
jgi:hypothetical protein